MDKFKEKVSKLIYKSEQFIINKPLESVGVSLIVGVVLGAIL